jgi:hypothetical protein
MMATNVGKELQALYQECHELTGAGSPECNAVLAIQDAVAALGDHIGKGMHAEPMPEEPPMEEPMPQEPPMGSSPFAEAARGFKQDMMGSVPPGASPLP